MKTEGGLFEEGHSPEIKRGVLVFLCSSSCWCGSATGGEGEVEERSARDMMRLGLKGGDKKKKKNGTSF